MARLTMLKPRLGAPAAAEQPWRKAHGVKRRAGSWLQQQRSELFRAEPWCRECARSSIRTLASIRDHVIPLGEGGTDDPSNIQPLCQTCSDRKTAAEARRARGLG